MKSRNFMEKILFILLFSALSLFVACDGSDEIEDTTDSDADTSDTDITDSDSNDTTSDGGDSTDDSADTTTDSADSNDDSDEPAGDTDTDTEPTNPTDLEPTGEPDSEFEQNAEGCTMIEVPKITMGGAYADEINGYLSPSLGDNAIDIIKILLMGDIKEGIYELGTGINDNYMQCQQCVMVWVDAELGAAKEYYFQTHGTLAIKEVKDVDGINRTTGIIKNLVLKQAETNEYLSDFTLIPEGKCIAAEIVEWDTTNTPNNSGD